jgi:hypothetical protein
VRRLEDRKALVLDTRRDYLKLESPAVTLLGGGGVSI